MKLKPEFKLTEPVAARIARCLACAPRRAWPHLRVIAKAILQISQRKRPALLPGDPRYGRNPGPERASAQRMLCRLA